MTSSQRGFKGDGYFVKKEKGFVFRIPDGVYENKTTKYLSFSGKSKREAYSRAMEYKETHLDKDTLAADPVLCDYIRLWLKIYKKESKAVRPQTYTRMCSVTEHQIIPKLGEYKVSDLTKTLIQSEMINPLLNEINPTTKKPLSLSTVSKALIHLKDCLNQAIDDEIIKRNPCKGIKLNSNMTTEQIDTPDAVRFFTDEEIERFATAAKATTVNGFPVYKYGDILTLDIYTGLRSGEFLALQKKDVELDKRRIKVGSGIINYYDMDEDSLTYKTTVSYHSNKTKTNSGFRYVPLCDEALKIVAGLVSRCKLDTDYLVSGGEKTMLYSNILRTYKQICARAEIPAPDGIHTLRHTCASLLLRNGTDIKIVSVLLGHSSVSFTYDTYIHLIRGQTDEAIRKVGQAMSGEDRRNQKEIVKSALEEGLSNKTVSRLLAVIPAEILGTLLSELCVRQH